MKKEKRFKEIYAQKDRYNIIRIIVDTKTGVNYIHSTIGSGGGITPLLDENGNVVVTKKEDIEKFK